MTDNRTTELLPCPHCGKVDTLEFATRRELEDCPNFDDCEAETCGRGSCDVYDNWDCVVCSVYKGGCGASSGYDECPAKAIEKWNTRTPEQAIAATLGGEHAERTCKVVSSYYYDDYDQYEFEFSCGHSVSMYDKEPPNYCPNCGAKVTP